MFSRKLATGWAAATLLLISSSIGHASPLAGPGVLAAGKVVSDNFVSQDVIKARSRRGGYRRGGYRSGGYRHRSYRRNSGSYRRHYSSPRSYRRYRSHRRYYGGHRRTRLVFSPYYGYGYGGYGYGYDRPYYGYSSYGYPAYGAALALTGRPYTRHRHRSYRGRGGSCRAMGVGSRSWSRCCSRKYKSFNRRTGRYLAYSGRYRRCR